MRLKTIGIFIHSASSPHLASGKQSWYQKRIFFFLSSIDKSKTSLKVLVLTELCITISALRCARYHLEQRSKLNSGENNRRLHRGQVFDVSPACMAYRPRMTSRYPINTQCRCARWSLPSPSRGQRRKQGYRQRNETNMFSTYEYQLHLSFCFMVAVGHKFSFNIMTEAKCLTL